MTSQLKPQRVHTTVAIRHLPHLCVRKEIKWRPACCMGGSRIRRQVAALWRHRVRPSCSAPDATTLRINFATAFALVHW